MNWLFVRAFLKVASWVQTWFWGVDHIWLSMCELYPLDNHSMLRELTCSATKTFSVQLQPFSRYFEHQNLMFPKLNLWTVAIHNIFAKIKAVLKCASKWTSTNYKDHGSHNQIQTLTRTPSSRRHVSGMSQKNEWIKIVFEW